MLSAQNGDEIFYYLHDDLGSPIRITSDHWVNEETFVYDEFGIPLHKHTSSQPFGFTGYQLDDISGTLFAQARQYSPEQGRFISEDRIKGAQTHPFTLNQYTYCWNQPMKYVDLDGLFPTDAEGNQPFPPPQRPQSMCRIHEDDIEWWDEDDATGLNVDMIELIGLIARELGMSKSDLIRNPELLSSYLLTQINPGSGSALARLGNFAEGFAKTLGKVLLFYAWVERINQNMEDGCTFGEAVAHSTGSTIVSVGTAIGAGIVLAPLGWLGIPLAIGAGWLMGKAYDYAYANWDGFRDGVNWFGHQIDRFDNWIESKTGMSRAARQDFRRRFQFWRPSSILTPPQFSR